MSLAAEKELEHIGETCGCPNHDHDLIHDLSKRLDALWRYDQYIANADGKPQLQSLWRDLKRLNNASPAIPSGPLVALPTSEVG